MCECGFNNSVVPGAPEFGMPWKMDNNSGCCYGSAGCKRCKKHRQRPLKIGCFVAYKVGNNTVYRSGQQRSIKVC